MKPLASRVKQRVQRLTPGAASIEGKCDKLAISPKFKTFAKDPMQRMRRQPTGRAAVLANQASNLGRASCILQRCGDSKIRRMFLNK